MGNIIENIRQIEEALKEIKATLGISTDNNNLETENIQKESEEKENKSKTINNIAPDNNTLDIEYLESLGDAQYSEILSKCNDNKELYRSNILLPDFSIGDNVRAFLPTILNDDTDKYIFGNKWITKEQAKNILPGGLDQSIKYRVPESNMINGVIVGAYSIDSSKLSIKPKTTNFNNKYVFYNVLYRKENEDIFHLHKKNENEDTICYCVLVERNYLKYSE